MAHDWTIGGAVNDLTKEFTEAGLDTPRLDARILVGAAGNLEPSLLFARADRALSAEEATTVRAFAARRLKHEPVSRILGHREFWGLDFKLNAATLDPRPDTETLVSAALARKAQYPGPRRILDLGTGTGCILLAILSEWPEATGLGIDRAPQAVEGATDNAARLGLTPRAAFREGNWCDGLEERFDLIVSNPPYIALGEAAALSPDVVRFDPHPALFGGEDGLEAYRALIPAAKPRLQEGGLLLLEIGATQAEGVESLLVAAGFAPESRVFDLGGKTRVVTARFG
ncbi:MAG: peptide chain release factor N(5)-glutamine methyltransferase [Proteobacteria bacterium]|nr:peptide chain release factor N(5)-glutamine methyltransferase [Pseudomonadota bacterium]